MSEIPHARTHARTHARIHTPPTHTHTPQEARLVEVCNTQLAEKDGGEHFTFDPKTGAPTVPSGSTFEDILKNQLGLKPDVVNSALKILSDLVTNGVGEKVYAKGFFFVITNDADERFLNRIVPKGLESTPWYCPAQLGLPPRFNKHGGPTKLNVLDLTGAGKRFLQPDLVCTGGIIVVDAQTGRIVVSRAEANKGMRVAEGTYDGVGVSTLDDREAVGIAAQGRCVVLTCTPENCQIDGTSGGSMRVFFHGGGEGVEVHGPAAGVRVVEVPTKAPATHRSAAEVGAEVSHPHYEFEPATGNPLYTEETLPVALQNEFRAETTGRGSNSTVQRRARNVSSKECMYLFLRFVFSCFVFCFVFLFTGEWLAFLSSPKYRAPALQIMSRRA